MSDPVFPTLAMDQDSKYYNIEQEDPSLKTKMEGGYVVSRARHTRKPRKTFSTGYSSIPDTDRKLLDTFYSQMRGGSLMFDWTDPIENVTYKVRFAEKMKFKYVGIGYTKLWDVAISLEQV